MTQYNGLDDKFIKEVHRMYERTITIDIDRHYTNRIPSVQGDDNRKVKIKLTNQGREVDLTGTRVVLSGVKPDGKEIFNGVEIEDYEKGIIVATLTRQINALVGQVECTLKIYDGVGVVSTQSFYVNVGYSPGTEEASSSNELEALTTALNEVQKLDERFLQTENLISGKASLEKVNSVETRIDNLIAHNNTTDGNSELLDMRVDVDGQVHQSSGEAVRKQFEKVKFYAIPDYCLDFKTRAKAFSGGVNKKITATEDSIKVVEMSANPIGNGGFDITLNPNIKNIEFDVEELNFGLNLGIYYYTGNSIKESYKTRAKSVSGQVTHTHVRFDLDWDVINAKFSTNGYDNVKLIVWNANGSKQNGYVHLTNIAINGFNSVKKVNADLVDIKTQLPTYARKGQIGFADVSNTERVVGITSTMIKWNSTSNMVYDQYTDTITFSYTSSTGNNGFQTGGFQSSGIRLIVRGEVTEINGELSCSLAGVDSEGTKKYLNLGVLREEGIFEYNIDLPKFFETNVMLDLTDVSVIFSNRNTVSVKVRNISIFDCDSKYSGTSLEGVLDDFGNKMEELTTDLKDNYTPTEDLDFSTIVNKPQIVGKTSSLRAWNSAEGLSYDSNTDSISFAYTKNGNGGVATSEFASFGEMLRISGDVTALEGRLGVTVMGVNKETGAGKYPTVAVISQTGKFEYLVDLKKHLNPEEIDFSRLKIIFSNNSSTLNVVMSNVLAEDFNSRYEGNLYNVLQDIENESQAYIQSVRESLNFGDIKNPLTTLATQNDLTNWGSGGLQLDGGNNEFYLFHNMNTGNTGGITKQFTSETNFVCVKGEVLETNIYEGGADTSKYQICLVGKKATDGSTTYIHCKYLNEIGKFNTIIDLNYMVVYKELDLNQPIQILVSSLGGPIDIRIKDFMVYESVLSQSLLVGNDLTETVLNIDQEITALKSSIVAVENKSGNTLVSPSGDKFALQVSDDGVLYATPIIPKKVLFIGNSLLLGHGTFGMCASNSKNDYYYHVTQFLKSYHPNGVYNKLIGSPFEMCENQPNVDKWINDTISTMDNDYELVIIQLGDNVNNEARNELFKTSCKQLLKAIRNYLPKARVAWVGEWYYSAQRQQIIAESCAETGSSFVDISPYARDKENQANIGDIITRDDGTTFEVVSSGVASHPGDKGMKIVADVIIDTLFK